MMLLLMCATAIGCGTSAGDDDETGTGGSTGTGGKAAAGSGGSSNGGSGMQVGAGTGGVTGTGGAGGAASDHFSFFVTSMAAIVELSGDQNGFGGDLTFGETGDQAGIKGADKICTAIAEKSMPGSGAKLWHAFLSTSYVDAIDRVGEGPWYDRLGRLLAMSKADLIAERPVGADPLIAKDLPNESGTPNHDPDGTGDVDNHDTLTGSNADGRRYSETATCADWTSSDGNTPGFPRVGHAWPREMMGGGMPGGGGRPPGGRPDGGMSGGGMDINMNHWISSLDEAGCGKGIAIVENGPPDRDVPTVGSGGGYGGFYCFAMKP